MHAHWVAASCWLITQTCFHACKIFWKFFAHSLKLQYLKRINFRGNQTLRTLRVSVNFAKRKNYYAIANSRNLWHLIQVKSLNLWIIEIKSLVNFADGFFNCFMHNVSKLSDANEKSCSKRWKILKMCLIDWGHYALKD